MQQLNFYQDRDNDQDLIADTQDVLSETLDFSDTDLAGYIVVGSWHNELAFIGEVHCSDLLKSEGAYIQHTMRHTVRLLEDIIPAESSAVLHKSKGDIIYVNGWNIKVAVKKEEVTGIIPSFE